MSIILSSLVIAIPICEFTITLQKTNEKTTLVDYSVFEGTTIPNKYPNTPYQSILEGATTTKRGIPAVFYADDLGETDIITEQVQAACDPTWQKLRIEHNGKTIFEKSIAEIFCNNDNICQEKENNLACPHDCPIQGDGYCSYKQDGICDTDCLAGEPDCAATGNEIIENSAPQQESPFATSVTEVQEAPPVQPKTSAVLIVGLTILALLIIILIYTIIHHRKKKSFAEQKFEEYHQK